MKLRNENKKVLIAIIAMLMLFSMVGCTTNGNSGDDGDTGNGTGQSTEGSYTTREDSDGNTIYGFDYGSTVVQKGWVVAEGHSTDTKTFFTREGDENDSQPDNIAINEDSNQYSADQHAQFKAAILKQLSAQVDGTSATVTASGTTTEAGDVMYAFTIKESNCTTVQYYIIGDEKHCLIQLSNYTGKTDANTAAKKMADEFKWK